MEKESASEKLIKIANASELESAIENLEQKRKLQEKELQLQFHQVTTQFKPGNIVRSTLIGIKDSTLIRNQLLKLVLGAGAGYVGSRFLTGHTTGLWRKALKAAVKLGVARFIVKRKREHRDDRKAAPSS